MVKEYSLRFKSARNRIPELVQESEFNYSAEALNTPDAVFDLVEGVYGLGRSPEEKVVLVTCNTKAQLNGIFLLSQGGADTSVVDPKSIFTRVLLSGATGFFLVHNHPSGDPTPSADDFAVTKNLISCSDMMGIRFLDHIVVGSNWISIRWHRPELWDKNSK